MIFRLRRLARKIRSRLRVWKFYLAPPKRPSGDPVLVHIGCGEVFHPDFINVDARPLPHVHHVTENIFNLEMFPNGAVDLVYMCHLLEHVKRFERESVLLEMYRVIKPGGILRIAVPDFDALVDLYIAHDRDVETIEAPLMGGQTYEHNFHYSTFTKPLLTKLLLSAGFSQVRPWDPNTAPYYAPMYDWAKKPITIHGKPHSFSLNLEAIK